VIEMVTVRLRMRRVKSLSEDFSALLRYINARKDPSLPPRANNVGWEQKGPVAKENATPGQLSVDTHQSRHLEKFLQCGTRCLALVQEYYRQDFELLQYPMSGFRDCS
jgi:hypothetical protein